MVFLNLMPELNSLAVTYKWSRRRQTIGLTVTIHGNLVIHAPQGTPEAKIAQVLARHRAWIERKAAARKAACARLKDGLAFFLGKPYRLTVVSGNPETVELTADEIRMRLSRAGSPAGRSFRPGIGSRRSCISPGAFAITARRWGLRWVRFRCATGKAAGENAARLEPEFTL